MQLVEAKVIVDELNNLLSEKPWFDFQVKKYSDYELVIHGGISLYQRVDLIIIFTDVFFMSIPTGWQTDTSDLVLHVREPQDERYSDPKFRESNHHLIFEFTPEDYPNLLCEVRAKTITYRFN